MAYVNLKTFKKVIFSFFAAHKSHIPTLYALIFSPHQAQAA